MLYALLLTLSLSLGLLLLSSLCRVLLHALTVRRTGVGTTVLVGNPDDALVPQRAAAALVQSGLCHLERPREVIVLDCGLSPQTADACRALLGGRVQFVRPQDLAGYLTATGREKHQSK